MSFGNDITTGPLSESKEHVLYGIELTPHPQHVTLLFRENATLRKLGLEIEKNLAGLNTGGDTIVHVRSVPANWSEEFIRDNKDQVLEHIGTVEGVVVVDRTLDPLLADLNATKVIRIYDNWVSNFDSTTDLEKQLDQMEEVIRGVEASGHIPLVILNKLGDHVTLPFERDPLKQLAAIEELKSHGIDMTRDYESMRKDAYTLSALLRAAYTGTRLAEAGYKDNLRYLDVSNSGNFEARVRTMVDQLMRHIQEDLAVTVDEVVVITDHHLSGIGLADALRGNGVDLIDSCPCCISGVSPTADKLSELIKKELQI